eukprot:3563648-Pyramimonas_sp.AAC.1
MEEGCLLVDVRGLASTVGGQRASGRFLEIGGNAPSPFTTGVARCAGRSRASELDLIWQAWLGDPPPTTCL